MSKVIHCVLNFRRRFRVGSWSGWLVAMSLAAFGIPPAVAANSNYQVCVPSLQWFGGSMPPPIDGTTNSMQWRGSWSQYFGANTNGTPTPEIVAQAIADSSNIYLSFEVQKLVDVSSGQDFNSDDAIYIAYDPTPGNTVANHGNISGRRLFILFPVQPGDGTITSHQGPYQMEMWYGDATATGTNYWTLQSALPSWLTPATNNVQLTTSAAANGDYVYSIDIKIPVGAAPSDAFPSPAGGSFGLYFNVLRTWKGNPSTTVEEAWPPYPDTTHIGNLGYYNTPDPSTWATGSLPGGACNGGDGVNISSSDITANNDGTALNPPGMTNTLQVHLHNATVNAVGQSVIAPQVIATFLSAPFGMPSQFTQIQLDPGSTQPNPTLPADVAPGASPTLQTGTWTLPQGTPDHVCVMVQLSARPPSACSTSGCANSTSSPPLSCSGSSAPSSCFNAVFVNSAAVANMYYGGMGEGEKFRGIIAELGTNGYKLVANQDYQLIDLRPRIEPVMIRDGNVIRAASEQAASQSLLWTVHGYRHTGETLVIHKNRYEIVDDIGSYGYGVTYKGPNPPKWRYQFFGERGQKLEQVNATTYQMRIPNGLAGYVGTAVEGDDAAPIGGPTTQGPGRRHDWWWCIVLALFLLIVGWLLGRRRRAHP